MEKNVFPLGKMEKNNNVEQKKMEKLCLWYFTDQFILQFFSTFIKTGM